MPNPGMPVRFFEKPHRDSPNKYRFKQHPR